MEARCWRMDGWVGWWFVRTADAAARLDLHRLAALLLLLLLLSLSIMIEWIGVLRCWGGGVRGWVGCDSAQTDESKNKRSHARSR